MLSETENVKHYSDISSGEFCINPYLNTFKEKLVSFKTQKPRCKSRLLVLVEKVLFINRV
jgi:hypothetical protein